MGVSLRFQNTKKSYTDDDIADIKPKKRDRRKGAKQTPTPNPGALRFKKCMWNRKNIAKLIRQKYGNSILESTLNIWYAGDSTCNVLQNVPTNQMRSR